MVRKRWVVAILAILFVACLAVVLPCVVSRVPNGYGWHVSTNALHQIGVGLHNYHDTHGKLPEDIKDKDGKAILSWRVAILPYIEQETLHRQFKLDELWDSPHNKPLSELMPLCYRLPRDVDAPGYTRYLALVGPGTAFERPGLRWDDFPDGPANTLMVVEARDAVPWAAPGDLAYDPNGPLPALGGAFTKPVKFLCHEVGRKAGFVACFGDGSVRFIPSSTDERLLRAVITRNGGERADPSGLD